METEVQAEATLGGDIEAAFDAVTNDTPEAETAEQRAERVRDERGRFAKTDGESDDPAKVAAVDAQRPQPAGTATTVVEQPERPQRPSSWKKDYWEHWDKLDPQVAQYINQREQEYAKGVSTYKNEWEQAKPLLDAMAPFQPLLQQHNIQPGQWISNLGNAHKVLATGTPQEKAWMFQRLAHDYGISLQGLSQQQQGQPDHLNPLYEQVSQLQGELNNFKSQQQKQEQQAIQSEIQKFASTHPHYESVRETMAGLLQSNVAPDLESAYEKAIRLHDDIFEKVQAEKAQASAQEKLKQTKETTRRARDNAVSPRSATASLTTTKSDKSLRGDLEEAFDDATSRV